MSSSKELKMTINVSTMSLPDFDDYTMEDETAPDGSHVSVQKYYKNEEVIAEIWVYFKVIDNEPLKWPFKFVVKDHTGQITITPSVE
jgi:hypothetical protein